MAAMKLEFQELKKLSAPGNGFNAAIEEYPVDGTGRLLWRARIEFHPGAPVTGWIGRKQLGSAEDAEKWANDVLAALCQGIPLDDQPLERDALERETP